jgi:hypothetical protein
MRLVSPYAATGLVVAGLLSAAGAQDPTHVRVWVLERPDHLVQYEAATFVKTQAIIVPNAAFQDGVRLVVNGRGQALIRLDDRTVWTWDGEKAGTWDSGAVTPAPNRRASPAREIDPHWFLAADGAHAFAAADVFTTVVGESGVERSRMGRFELWQADLSGGARQTLLTEPLPACSCGTGVCSETCLESQVWAPDGIIDSFFFLTRWVPGQIGPTFESTRLYRERDARWQGVRLPAPVEAFLDASADGGVWIEAVPDTGCCGWSNESDDQTVLVREGHRVVLFDEFRRFGNQDYDVSFFTMKARLSPDGRQVALGIQADVVPGSDPRLAADGHENAEALKAIRQALQDLPEVDVSAVETPDAPNRRIPHAELVGWLNDSEILVLEKGVLVAVDVATGDRRESGIGARRLEDVRITGFAR